MPMVFRILTVSVRGFTSACQWPSPSPCHRSDEGVDGGRRVHAPQPREASTERCCSLVFSCSSFRCTYGPMRKMSPAFHLLSSGCRCLAAFLAAWVTGQSASTMPARGPGCASRAQQAGGLRRGLPAKGRNLSRSSAGRSCSVCFGRTTPMAWPSMGRPMLPSPARALGLASFFSI